LLIPLPTVLTARETQKHLNMYFAFVIRFIEYDKCSVDIE